MQKKKYIVLLSGFPFSPIKEIVSELEKDFNAIVLNYLHLDLNDDLTVINNRVSDLLKKHFHEFQEVRLLGVQVSNLEKDQKMGGGIQLEFDFWDLENEEEE